MLKIFLLSFHGLDILTGSYSAEFILNLWTFGHLVILEVGSSALRSLSTQDITTQQKVCVHLCPSGIRTRDPNVQTCTGHWDLTTIALWLSYCPSIENVPGRFQASLLILTWNRPKEWVTWRRE